jgi:exopolyphosphatase/pppGpp-phosphohydrolase
VSKLAVIDIGTNSIHMVLAEILPDASFKILDRFKDMTRLGNGVFATKRLSDEAMTRALEVLKTLVTLARNKGFERIVAVATSAVREAQNGGDLFRSQAQYRPPGRPVARGGHRGRLRRIDRGKSGRFDARPQSETWCNPLS